MEPYLKERRKNSKGYKAQGNGQMEATQAITNYRETKSYVRNNQDMLDKESNIYLVQ